MRWSVFLLFIACTRSNPSEVVVAVPSAPPAVSTALPPAPSASAPPKAIGPNRVMVGGDLVDLDTMTVVRTVTKDSVMASAVTTDIAYVWTNGELRAYDLKGGAIAWSKTMRMCWHLQATRGGAFCSSDSGTRFYKRSNGDDAPAGSTVSVVGMVRIGTRVLVAHSDRTLDALDENGAVVATITLPFAPSTGWTHNALLVTGSLACGAQGSNTGTQVACIDTTPHVVWSRTATVPGGTLEQADDLLLVGSDAWSKPGSSEVLRTSDGASLLHSSVRLAAALSTGGTFDGALAADPKITFFDAKGVVKWTAPVSPFHDEALHAVRVGPNIVVAQHSPIATGVRLLALDEATGSLAWQGNVDSLSIAHSKYSNQVELRKNGKTLLLLGRESSQEYAQSFDPASGSRLVSILRGR